MHNNKIQILLPAPGDVRWLICGYRSDVDSTYRKLRYFTRVYYDTLCRRLDTDFGTRKLGELKARDILHWNEAIIAEGHLPLAHSLVGMLRTVINFGATILENEECERLSSMLHKMRFPMGKSRSERLTADQAIAIRNQAHKVGKPSIALAQAIQFEGTFRQKDIVGEYVPVSEPGHSDTFREGQKWLRGIRWEEISDDFILTHITSKRQKEITVDLKLAPMVMEELALAAGFELFNRSHFPVSGPVIFCEHTGLPWIANEFRRHWRILARQVGIPDAVRNMDSRAGAISEATDAGADLEHVRQAATHSDIAMTQKYSRGTAEKVAGVMKLRVEHRKKAQG